MSTWPDAHGKVIDRYLTQLRLRQPCARASEWQRGQWRSRQLWNAMRLWPAVIALLDMSAERSGPAQFDRRHDAKLGGRQRRVVPYAIGFAVAAEYVRHFRPRAGHCRAAQKYCGLAGGGRVGAGRGKSSKGLDAAQTLLVAIGR